MARDREIQSLHQLAVIRPTDVLLVVVAHVSECRSPRSRPEVGAASLQSKKTIRLRYACGHITAGGVPRPGVGEEEIIWIRVWPLRWSGGRVTSTADCKRMRSLVPRSSTLSTEVLSSARLRKWKRPHRRSSQRNAEWRRSSVASRSA